MNRFPKVRIEASLSSSAAGLLRRKLRQRMYELKLIQNGTIRLFRDHAIIYHISVLPSCLHKGSTLVGQRRRRHNRHNGVQEKDIVTEQDSPLRIVLAQDERPAADKETTQSEGPLPEARNKPQRTKGGDAVSEANWEHPRDNLETGQQLARVLRWNSKGGRAQSQWKKRGLNTEVQNRSVSLRLLHHAGCGGRGMGV